MPRYDITRKSLQPVWAEDEDFGAGLDLDAPVGARRENRVPDVKTVETALGAVGYLDPRRAARPTGAYDSGLDASVRSYQDKARLKRDGLINPGGPTITGLSTGKAANIIPSRRVGDEAVGAANRLVRAMGKTRDQTEVSKLLADTALNYGERGQAEVSHIIRQAAQENPEGSANLQDALATQLPATLHRALYARAMSNEEDDGGDDSDYGDTPTDEETPPDAEKPQDPKKPESGKEGEDEKKPEEDEEGEKKPEEPKPDCTQEKFDEVESLKRYNAARSNIGPFPADIHNLKEVIKVDEAELAHQKMIADSIEAGGGLASLIRNPIGEGIGLTGTLYKMMHEPEITALKEKLNKNKNQLEEWNRKMAALSRELESATNAYSAAKWKLEQCRAGKSDGDNSKDKDGAEVSV